MAALPLVNPRESVLSRRGGKTQLMEAMVMAHLREHPTDRILIVSPTSHKILIPLGEPPVMPYNPSASFAYAAALGLPTVSYTAVGPAIDKLLAAFAADITTFDRTGGRIYLCTGAQLTVSSDRIALEAGDNASLATLSKRVQDALAEAPTPHQLLVVAKADARKAQTELADATAALKKRQERIDELTRENKLLVAQKAELVRQRDAEKRNGAYYREQMNAHFSEAKRLRGLADQSALVESLREYIGKLETEVLKARADARVARGEAKPTGAESAQSMVYSIKLLPVVENPWKGSTQTLEARLPLEVTRLLQGRIATVASVKMNHDTGKGDLTIQLDTPTQRGMVKEMGHSTLEFRF